MNYEQLASELVGKAMERTSQQRPPLIGLIAWLKSIDRKHGLDNVLLRPVLIGTGWDHSRPRQDTLEVWADWECAGEEPLPFFRLKF